MKKILTMLLVAIFCTVSCNKPDPDPVPPHQGITPADTVGTGDGSDTTHTDPVPELLTFTVDDVMFRLAYVEGGTFIMGGTPEQEPDIDQDVEWPTHEVTLSDYYMGTTEVTLALWQAVMGSDYPNGRADGPEYPVGSVYWSDAQTFAEELSSRTGRHFVVPTEAQWEYAARGGQKSRNYKYAGGNEINVLGWYKSNSGDDSHPVALKTPNELGLYDMCGNINEWCADWRGAYTEEPQTDPTGPASSPFNSHVLRGGCYWYSPKYCRVSFRDSWNDNQNQPDIGFRIAMLLD